MYTPSYIKKQNVYTRGNEYMIDGEPYVGYYNMTATGPYTGRVYDSGTSRELYILKSVPTINARTYLQLATDKGHTTDIDFDDPVQASVFPNQDDIDRGYMLRYFIQQRNDKSARIREIDGKQHKNLLDPSAGINSSFYKGIVLKWKITGPRNDIMNRGTISVPGIEDSNRRTIQRKEFEMKGIQRFLFNKSLEFSQFAPPNNSANIDIKKL